MKNKQKFNRNDFVRTLTDRIHGAGQLAIIEGSYKNIYGGDDVTNYAVWILNKAGTKIVNSVAWYDESELEFVKVDNDLANQLINDYD